MAVLAMRCPHCGKLNDAASAVSGDGPRVPDAGSVSLCFSCGKWAVYEDDFVGLRQRIPTEAEWESMQRDETVQKVSAAWEQTYGKRR